MMKELGGLILAAGLSSRMGEFKPLIEINGRSMIGHVIDRMRGAGAQIIVVVTGYRRYELEKQLDEENVEFVYNKAYARSQQLESLKLGLRTLAGRCRTIMISPADVPLVNLTTIKALMEQEGDFIRPLFRGEPGHPVFLQEKWIPYLESYHGPGGLKGAVEKNAAMHLVSLEVMDMGVILDNDTKEDLERLMLWDKENSQKVSNS